MVKPVNQIVTKMKQKTLQPNFLHFFKILQALDGEMGAVSIRTKQDQDQHLKRAFVKKRKIQLPQLRK